jgi:hypothetical protein
MKRKKTLIIKVAIYIRSVLSKQMGSVARQTSGLVKLDKNEDIVFGVNSNI